MAKWSSEERKPVRRLIYHISDDLKREICLAGKTKTEGDFEQKKHKLEMNKWNL